MRTRYLVAATLVGLGLGAATGLDAEPGPSSAPTGHEKAERAAPRHITLDDLFTRLAESKDASEAKGVANLIERRLSHSGSDTADLLMARSGEALQSKDAALAVELLDRVTQLKPDWAEAWSRRATAFYLLDDPADALADLHQALSHEPRLFDAWVAVGQIEMADGNKPLALQAFRRALAIHPYLEHVKEMVERLAPDIDGRDL